jgi:hypothetical protein
LLPPNTGGLNFFRSIVTFSRGSRPEFALRRPLEFRTVPSEADLHVGREFLLFAARFDAGNSQPLVVVNGSIAIIFEFRRGTHNHLLQNHSVPASRSH